jgi:hypothetical protein
LTNDDDADLEDPSTCEELSLTPDNSQPANSNGKSQRMHPPVRNRALNVSEIRENENEWKVTVSPAEETLISEGDNSPKLYNLQFEEEG